MEEQEFIRVPVQSLVYSGRNPRTEMKGLEELSDNIRQYGLLQPIIVRANGEKFELVVGERRFRASQMAGLKEVPAIVRDLTDAQTDELRLIENIHREDLTNAEKGDAAIALWENYPDEFQTFKAVAESLNVKYDTLQMWLRYSRKISNSVREHVGSSNLGEDHARFLLKYDRDTQDRLADVMIRHSLTTSHSREFLKLYDMSPDEDLDELAQEAMGVQIVKVSLKKLPERVRREVKKVADEKPKVRPQTEETRRKASETLKDTAKRKRERKGRRRERGTSGSPSLLPYVDGIKPVEKLEESPRENEVSEEIERLTEEVTRRIGETASLAPDKVDRVSEIVGEELDRMEKRLIGFPERSRAIQPKFDRLTELEERGVLPYTVWDFRYRDDYAGDKDFHGNCSPQIVEQCVWRLSEEGDLVVDPMAGSGTTIDVCEKYNRKCIGYDLKPVREDIVQNDSGSIPLDDESVDLVFIHPPYWNLVHYTTSKEKLPDLSRAKTASQFIHTLEGVFMECHRILKPGKFMCVLLGDLIRNGRFVPLCRKTANMAESIGFSDYGHAVKLAHGEVSRKKSGVIIAEPLYTDNLKVSHDLVMFLRKHG